MYPVSRCLVAAAVLVVALGGALPAHAQELHLIPGVAEIAADTLEDVAVTSVDSPIPTIYYNPARMQRYGPLLATFFLAHEYGHIYHHHTRAGLADAAPSSRDSLLGLQELEADCYAAEVLGARNRPAVEAALRFFTRLGPFRFDPIHPTGAQRVSKILECLPTSESQLASALRSGETGVERGPVGGPPDRVRFTVTSAVLPPDGYGRDVTLWIDGRPAGYLSNLKGPTVLAIDSLTAGLHSYRMNLEIYGVDQSMQRIAGETVTGKGYFSVKDGDAFRVRWSIGETPELVRTGD